MFYEYTDLTICGDKKLGKWCAKEPKNLCHSAPATPHIHVLHVPADHLFRNQWASYARRLAPLAISAYSQISHKRTNAP